MTAEALAAMGATVVVVSRNAERCAATVQRISQATGNNNVDWISADLSVMAKVRDAAEAFRARYDRLDILVNNAGAYFSRRQVTEDGFEMTFALNHLSYFLLTDLLLDRLTASAPARIVNVASGAHKQGQIKFDDLMGESQFDGWSAYSQSKLANVMFTYELARRLAGQRVTANVLHPGFVATGFGRNNGGLVGLLMPLVQLFAMKPHRGATASIYLASSPEVEGVTSKYFVAKKDTKSSAASYDEAAQRRLWEISDTLVRAALSMPA